MRLIDLDLSDIGVSIENPELGETSAFVTKIEIIGTGRIRFRVATNALDTRIGGKGTVKITVTARGVILDDKPEVQFEVMAVPEGDYFYSNGYGGVFLRKDRDDPWTRVVGCEKSKDETIEEAYLNKLIEEANKVFTLDGKLAKEVAIEYAKWQVERIYSNITECFEQFKKNNINL
jgi:hypothetical protein